jgi:hypothetical protein
MVSHTQLDRSYSGRQEETVKYNSTSIRPLRGLKSGCDHTRDTIIKERNEAKWIGFLRWTLKHLKILSKSDIN